MIIYFVCLCIGFAVGFILCGLLINAGKSYRAVGENKPVEKVGITESTYHKVEKRQTYPGRVFIGEC